MAIINVTPDSFSGDGTGTDVDAALALARDFEAAGADIIDIGGESTRPDATPLAPEEEASRVIPAIRAIRAATTLPLSIDTMHASVAAAAFEAGADMLNDVSGLRNEPAIAESAGRQGAPVIAMHNQRGRQFHDVVADIHSGFHESLAIAGAAGIPDDHIILDPGFGFGWTPEQNLEMVRRLPELWELGYPLLIGPSRKSTLGFVTGQPVEARLAASASAVALGIAGGADIVRVHDVREMRDVALIADSIVRGNWRSS
jgi:dihydropteroate synthase